MDTSGLGSIPSASVTGQLPTRASEPHVSYSADGDDHEQLARDPLDDILDQYQFHWVPEYRLKLKKE